MGIVARLTAQYVERAPADAELFSKGVHEATGTFEIGNPFLEKEAAKTIELGFRKAKGPFRFDASAYYTVFDGFIFKQLTGVKCDDTLASCGAGTELDQVLYSQRAPPSRPGPVRRAGYRRIWKGVWGIDGRYDFVHASFDDALGGNVPRIPPHRAGAGLIATSTGSRAWASCTPSTRTDRRQRQRPGLHPARCRPCPHLQARRTERPGAEMTIGIRARTCRRRRAQPVSFKKDEVLPARRTIRLYGTVGELSAARVSMALVAVP
jgi:iron complex outermembrane receptor protein